MTNKQSRKPWSESLGLGQKNLWRVENRPQKLESSTAKWISHVAPSYHYRLVCQLGTHVSSVSLMWTLNWQSHTIRSLAGVWVCGLSPVESIHEGRGLDNSQKHCSLLSNYIRPVGSDKNVTGVQISVKPLALNIFILKAFSILDSIKFAALFQEVYSLFSKVTPECKRP